MEAKLEGKLQEKLKEGEEIHDEKRQTMFERVAENVASDILDVTNALGVVKKTKENPVNKLMSLMGIDKKKALSQKQ